MCFLFKCMQLFITYLYKFLTLIYYSILSKLINIILCSPTKHNDFILKYIPIHVCVYTYTEYTHI